MRILSAPLALLVVAGACRDLPTQAEPIDSAPVLLSLSDPPPPPAEIDTDNPDPPTCDPCPPPPPPGPPPPAFVAIGVNYFKNPSNKLAYVTFWVSVSSVEISPGARVSDRGSELIGRGTIETDVHLQGDANPVRVVVDLSTATGSLFGVDKPTGGKRVIFYAEARTVNGGVPLPSGVFFAFDYGI